MRSITKWKLRNAFPRIYTEKKGLDNRIPDLVQVCPAPHVRRIQNFLQRTVKNDMEDY